MSQHCSILFQICKIAGNLRKIGAVDDENMIVTFFR